MTQTAVNRQIEFVNLVVGIYKLLNINSALDNFRTHIMA